MPLVRRSTSPYWYVQFRHAGRTVVRSTKTVDRKAAEKFETRLRAEAYAKGTLAELGQTTLIAAIDRLVETKVGTANHRNLLNHRNAIASTLGGRMMISSLRSAAVDTRSLSQTAQSSVGMLWRASRICLRSPPYIRMRYQMLSGASDLSRRVPPSGLPAVRIMHPRVCQQQLFEGPNGRPVRRAVQSCACRT